MSFVESQQGGGSGLIPGAASLQPMRFADFIFDTGLYVRETKSFSGSFVQSENGELKLFGPQRVSFDSFFNSFYERHWSRYTNIDDVRLVLEVSGQTRIEIFRVSPWSGKTQIASAHTDGNKRICEIVVPREHLSAEEPGRLHFEIDSAGPEAILHRGAWATRSTPLRQSKVSIVICTYNKASCLIKNMAMFLRAYESLRGLAQIIVVDQGSAKLTDQPEFQTLFRDADFKLPLKLIEQPNFGGAGGFTRGIVEFLKSDSTHILLMDDDVVIDPGAFERLVRLLDFANEDYAIGGEMLDLFRPNILHSHAEQFDTKYALTTRTEPFERDLRLQETLDALIEPQKSNFSAWFLCCYPRDVFERCGLPLPVFVRSDDCEFGTRVSTAGVEFIHLPGFCVWHEPFYAKSRAWIEYYSYRNHLISAVMQVREPQATWSRRYFGAFMYYIRTFQYDHALALCLAVEDFMKGPGFVYGDPRRRHAALLATLNEVQPVIRSRNKEELSNLKSTSGFHPKLPRALGEIANVIWTLWFPGTERKDEPRKTILYKDLDWPTTHGFKAIDVLNPHLNEIMLLQQNAPLARKLCRQMISLLFKWRWNEKSIHQHYVSATPNYTTIRFWTDYLGIGTAEEGA